LHIQRAKAAKFNRAALALQKMRGRKSLITSRDEPAMFSYAVRTRNDQENRSAGRDRQGQGFVTRPTHRSLKPDRPISNAQNPFDNIRARRRTYRRR
jgi:hypothetical protein